MARFNARRQQQVRNPLPRVLIVCDDARTAPAYFAELSKVLRRRCSVRIVAAPYDDDKVIEQALTERDKVSDADGDTVWALVDLEMAPGSDARLTEWRGRADKDRVGLLFSQPCFEVWTLAYFVSTGQQFRNCDAVLREVKKRWQSKFGEDFPQKKAQADYRKLMNLLDAAVSNAKPHRPSTSQSWTEVWRLVEYATSLPEV